MKKLEELDLLDDFLFGKLMSDPVLGEEFGRELLWIIFGKRFDKLEVVPQKVYYGSDTDLHGTRMDVYLEEMVDVPFETEDSREMIEQSGEANTVFDLEAEQMTKKKYRLILPKRVRFYHAKIDATSLKSGDSYGKLKNVIVVMIMPFDPFDRNRMVYTIANGCKEEPDMEYDDGARTLFLYTDGTKGNPPEELKQLMRYMKCSTEINAVNESLARIHRMVEKVKQSEEVSLEYMKICEKEEMLREEGREEGREIGKEIGIRLAKQVIRMDQSGVSREEIAKKCEITIEDVDQILDDEVA